MEPIPEMETYNGHMGPQTAFAEFERLLKERLTGKFFTTEDTIRYTLYLALTTSRWS